MAIFSFGASFKFVWLLCSEAGHEHAGKQDTWSLLWGLRSNMKDLP